jgi:hypothetical protein
VKAFSICRSAVGRHLNVRRRSIGACARFLFVAALWACSTAALAQREKTDIVLLRNGDKVTGEIVSLQYGILQLSTDSMGTVNIEWPAIAAVESEYNFDIEIVGGDRHYGSIGTSEDGESLVVTSQEEQTSIPLGDVTRLAELEGGFWQRVNGSLSVGFNYTHSSGISVGSISVASQYQGERVKASLNLSAIRTSSPDAETTEREQLSSAVQFIRDRPGFWVLLNSLERNEELGIKTRLQSGGALARYLHQSPDSEITVLSGVVFNQEWTIGEDESQQSLEGVLGGAWRVFRFSDPEVSLASSLFLYPSLTESGRYRGSLDTTLRRELISDLFFDVSLYYSYDTDPPAADAEKNDYGIVTSLGYKF